MWSASMLVITASTGVRYRNDASDSSASATRNSPLPRRACASADEQPAADDERRVEAALGEHRRDEARRRRLAVRARDRDALLHPHQLGQHQRARHDRHAALARGHDFGVVGGDRGRHDDRVGVGDVGRRVADGDLDAEALEAARRGARGEIRAGHPVALRRQHFGDAAHAGAADADEVHALDLVLHRAPAARQSRRCAPRRRCGRRARARIASASAAARVMPAIVAASVAASSRSCGDACRGAGVDEIIARWRSARRRSRRAAAR